MTDLLVLLVPDVAPCSSCQDGFTSQEMAGVTDTLVLLVLDVSPDVAPLLAAIATLWTCFLGDACHCCRSDFTTELASL